MTDFVLFGTEGCHLCEQAEQLLLSADLVFQKQDIVFDEQWLQRTPFAYLCCCIASAAWSWHGRFR